jgi:hypothetical protein
MLKLSSSAGYVGARTEIPEWTPIVVPYCEAFRFPKMCPGCLKPEPETHLRVNSEKNLLTGFYLVVTKWEGLCVTVPFCATCAARRRRWETCDLALLLIAVLAAFVSAFWFAISLNAEPWAFWVVFLGAAVFFTALFNWLLTDHREVRIKRYDGDAVTFAFSHPEYGREFARLNG